MTRDSDLLTRDRIRAPIHLKSAFPEFELKTNPQLRNSVLVDKVTPTKDYYRAFLKRGRFNSGSRLLPTSLTLKELLAAWDQEKQIQSIEAPLPRSLHQFVLDNLAIDVPTIQGLLLLFFAGYRGHVSETHFDGDYRDVLMVQLHGIKTLEFWSDVSFDSLQPIFSHATGRRPFINQTTSRPLRITLNPGDGLVFPGFLWHRATHDSHNLSFAIRFGICPILRFLGIYCHKDFNSRILVEGLRDGSRRKSFSVRPLMRIIARGVPPLEKLREMEKLFFALASRLGENTADPQNFQIPGYRETADELVTRGLYSRAP